jgi:hypothetical protein
MLGGLRKTTKSSSWIGLDFNWDIPKKKTGMQYSIYDLSIYSKEKKLYLQQIYLTSLYMHGHRKTWRKIINAAIQRISKCCRFECIR